MAPRQLTTAELTAAKLREMARDLILQAEALEASEQGGEAARPRSKSYRNPLTGKSVERKRIEL